MKDMTREEYLATKRRWLRYAAHIKLVSICEPTNEIAYWNVRFSLWNPLTWVLLCVAFFVYTTLRAGEYMKEALIDIKDMYLDNFNGVIDIIKDGGRVR